MFCPTAELNKKAAHAPVCGRQPVRCPERSEAHRSRLMFEIQSYLLDFLESDRVSDGLDKLADV
jgi:hypothetical protein